MLGVLRPDVPIATPFGKPSVKCRIGWWQCAQEMPPLSLSRRSKNRAWPKRAARGLSATALLGSGGNGGRASSDSDASMPSSASLQGRGGASRCQAWNSAASVVTATTAKTAARFTRSSSLEFELDADEVAAIAVVDFDQQLPFAVHVKTHALDPVLSAAGRRCARSGRQAVIV